MWRQQAGQGEGKKEGMKEGEEGAEGTKEGGWEEGREEKLQHAPTCVLERLRLLFNTVFADVGS